MAEAGQFSDIFPGAPTHGCAAFAAQRIYDELRRRILNLDLAPDTPLSRGALAKEFGVSLTPLREAMQQLEQDGLVRIFPQSRTVVARIDMRQLHETHFLRVALETEVARTLAARGDAQVLERAQSVLSMQESLRGDVAQIGLFYRLDRVFHRTLFEGAGMAGLHQLLARRSGHLLRCQRLELPREGKITTILAAHAAILEGVRRGDPDEAAAAMRGHLSGTILRLDSLRAERPAYFTNA